jgi:[ribosomal protein S18]-alanine N-acetyltransferase
MTSERITLEIMREADVPAVAALQALAFAVDGGAAPDARANPRSEEHRVSESQLREELARPWARLWILREAAAQDDVSREGAAGVLAFLIAWHVADELHVLSVATNPEHRRKGLARRLMVHAIDFARIHKGRLILLEVRRSNANAIALYRSLAFFAMNVRRAYYADGEDAVEMALVMDPETGILMPRADDVRIDEAT